MILSKVSFFSLLGIFVSFILSLAFAASDSLAVLIRPDKVLIQINEPKSDARLQEFMNAMGVGEEIMLLSGDQGVKIDCGRNSEAATCIFRFLQSPWALISENELNAALPLSELKDAKGEKFEIDQTPREWRFENSRGVIFVLSIDSHGLSFNAIK